MLKQIRQRIPLIVMAVLLAFVFSSPLISQATPAYATVERYAMFRVYYDTNANNVKDTGESYASNVTLSYHYCVTVSCGWVWPSNVTTNSNGYVTFFSAIDDGPTMYLVEVQVVSPSGYYWTITTQCREKISYSGVSPNNIYQVVGIHTGCSGE